ncbi:MAG: hypothetical protein UW94_C0002G0057 [Parcubacteria group bacterium GW2011_GWA2_45_14]|nr:MAG: hypothetical protein UW94_C0002G0057 [Parcubacteria group bacterium GW2011_GWA2_45_14]
MRIIVQKVVGGFRARCESDQEWSDLGKTMLEAVGKLVHDSPRRFGNDWIVWLENNRNLCGGGFAIGHLRRLSD